MSRLFQRCAFVAMTTTDLARARKFWVKQMGFPVVIQKRGEYFMVDAAGMRLCVDLADGGAHRGPGSDPVIGLKVASLEKTLAGLKRRSVNPSAPPVRARRGSYAELTDPDGRRVVITEVD